MTLFANFQVIEVIKEHGAVAQAEAILASDQQKGPNACVKCRQGPLLFVQQQTLLQDITGKRAAYNELLGILLEWINNIPLSTKLIHYVHDL